MDDSFEWKVPTVFCKNVVIGDIVSLNTHIVDKMYELFGMTKEEVRQHFSKNFNACADMVMGRHGDNKVISAFKEATGTIGIELISRFKMEVGCAGLSNPQLFNLHLPDQLMVKEITGNTFKVKFLDIQLTQQWAKEENSDLVKNFIEDLTIEIGSNDYFVMSSSF